MMTFGLGKCHWPNARHSAMVVPSPSPATAGQRKEKGKKIDKGFMRQGPGEIFQEQDRLSFSCKVKFITKGIRGG